MRGESGVDFEEELHGKPNAKFNTTDSVLRHALYDIPGGSRLSLLGRGQAFRKGISSWDYWRLSLVKFGLQQLAALYLKSLIMIQQGIYGTIMNVIVSIFNKLNTQMVNLCIIIIGYNLRRKLPEKKLGSRNKQHTIIIAQKKNAPKMQRICQGFQAG